MEENIVYKKCSRCKELKPVSEFTKFKLTKDNLMCHCRVCERKRVKLWVENNKEKDREIHKIYYQKNKEKIYKTRKLWLKKNEEKMKEYYREYYKKHKNKLKK